MKNNDIMHTNDIENEALDLLRRYRSLQELDKAREKMIAKYGEKDFLAIRSRFALLWLDVHSGVVTLEKAPVSDISPAKRAENRAKRIERKKKLKEGTLVYATKKTAKKRGSASISLPSSKRAEPDDDDEHKLPPARIIYTPMGNKR